MKNSMLFVTFVFIFISSFVYSQQQSDTVTKENRVDESKLVVKNSEEKIANALSYELKGKIEATKSPKVNPELIDQFFYEVHKGSEYKMDNNRKKIYLEQLARFSFIYSPYVENDNHPLLSSIPRKDKYNKSIDYSLAEFKPEEFNFIKYNFNFYLPYSQMIRVDGLDYLIKISAYKQN